MFNLPASGKVKGVYFSLGITPNNSPELDCAAAICSLFNSAKESAYVAIYALTETKIVDAIIAAKNRGIDIILVVDSTQSNGKNMKAAINKLLDANVDVRIARKQKACMHNKVAIIDRKIVATGSYNYTNNGTRRNDENLVILEGVQVASLYMKYVFRRILTTETMSRM